MFYTVVNLPGGLKLTEPTGFGSGSGEFFDPGELISSLLPYVLIVGGIVLFAVLLIGGFEILTSVGNEEKLKAGVERIKNALIGFLLLFGVYWLAQIAQVLFKIPIL